MRENAFCPRCGAYAAGNTNDALKTVDVAAFRVRKRVRSEVFLSKCKLGLAAWITVCLFLIAVWAVYFFHGPRVDIHNVIVWNFLAIGVIVAVMRMIACGAVLRPKGFARTDGYLARRRITGELIVRKGEYMYFLALAQPYTIAKKEKSFVVIAENKAYRIDVRNLVENLSGEED